MPEPTPEGTPDPVVAWVDRFLRPLFTDNTLWPVLTSVTLMIIVLIAVLLVTAWRDHAIVGWVAMGLLGLFTFDVVRREVQARHRPGGIFVAAVVLWSLGALVAVLVSHYGLF